MDYDLALINGRIVVLTSIKHKLDRSHIDQFLKKQIPTFKKDYPAFKKHRLYGAVASYILSDEMEKVAEDAGLYVFAQSGEKVKILNKKTFQAKNLN